jgi:hypothetical protein
MPDAAVSRQEAISTAFFAVLLATGLAITIGPGMTVEQSAWASGALILVGLPLFDRLSRARSVFMTMLAAWAVFIGTMIACQALENAALKIERPSTAHVALGVFASVILALGIVWKIEIIQSRQMRNSDQGKAA